jgi:hypothetical protein
VYDGAQVRVVEVEHVAAGGVEESGAETIDPLAAPDNGCVPDT